MKRKAINSRQMTIPELKKRVNEFTANFNRIAAEVIDGNQDVLDLNREQLQDSRMPNDQAITPDYSPFYAAYKREFHPSSYGDGRVNLFLYGNLYKTMNIKVLANEYIITTDVPYAGKLKRKYGEYLGISPKNQPKAQQLIGLKLQQAFKDQVLK